MFLRPPSWDDSNLSYYHRLYTSEVRSLAALHRFHVMFVFPGLLFIEPSGGGFTRAFPASSEFRRKGPRVIYKLRLALISQK